MMMVLRKSILRPKRIGHGALFQDLEQQVHDVRMGLLDLVEKHHGIRTATHRFGKLAAFLVTDVARRRADQTAGGEFLHVFRHVDLDERLGIAEHELGEIAREEGLADPGRSEEEEGTDRAARVLEVGAGAAQGLGDGDDRLVLADDAALELVLHLEKLLGFLLLHAVERHAGPLGDDGHDVVVRRRRRPSPRTVARQFLRVSSRFFLAFFSLSRRDGGLLEILLLDGRLLLAVDLLDLCFEFLDVRRARHRRRCGRGRRPRP